MIYGKPRPEPWMFPTSNVRMMIEESLSVIAKVSYESGATEVDLLVAINNLHHAAEELERSVLEMKYGVKREF